MDKDKQEYLKSFTQNVENLVQRGEHLALLGQIAVSLERIALAQEAVVELAQADLEESINAAVEERAQVLAERIDEDKTRRSFIGKRP
jgi:exonuclease III